MKKIILTGTALMAFAAAGFAQNSSTINQNGTSQSTSQTQNGNRNNTTVEQLQGGSTNFGNRAVTNQTGTSGGSPAVVNNATIQENEGANGNRAGITQNATGSGGFFDGNTGTIRQGNNSGSNTASPVGAGDDQAAVTGNGGNWADMQQTGRQLVGTIEQDGTGTNASAGNAALMNQQDRSHLGTIRQSAGGNGNSTDNTATLNQFGAGNAAVINQRDRSSGNTATTTQYGRNSTDVLVFPNLARIDQDGTLAPSTNSKATINQGAAGAAFDANEAYSSQRGDGNEVRINQLAGDGNQAGRALLGTSPVIQVGDRNLTTIDQSGNANRANLIEAYGDDNTISINQVSTGLLLGNTAEVRMQTVSSPDNDKNFVSIDQDGANNNAVFDLRASNSVKPGAATLKIEQDGRNNNARMSVGNQANDLVGAPGTDNTVDIQQTSGNAVLAAGHVINGGIQGNGNDVTIDQTGSGNTIGSVNNKGLRIIGDDNTATLNQSNNNNQMNLRVAGGTLGHGNTIAITQTGNNNRVGTGGITDGTSNAVTNASALGLFVAGDGNQLTINQNGGDEVKATQDGNDKLTVNQQSGGTSAAIRNRVLINQSGGTGSQDADITQNGDGNFVYGLTGSAGAVNTFAAQSGAGTNTLTVKQTGAGAGTSNTAFIGQNGAGNAITVDQTKQ